MLDNRFWSKVNKHGPFAGRLGRCWMWTACTNPNGYGVFYLDGGPQLAARVAWGDVSDGLCVLHRCDNPPCVRRSHLFLGTKADNSRDMAAKGRSPQAQKIACPAGHPYNAKNTRVIGGSRHCRACGNARHRAATARHRMAA